MQPVRSSDFLNTAPNIKSTFTRIFYLLPLLLTGLAMTGVRAEAQSQVRAVRLSDVEGGVQILRGDQTQFEQAFPNMPVLEGSRLQTGNDGRAEVQFEDGAVARLTPNSSLNFNQLSRAAGGGTVNQLEVLGGLVYFEAGADRNQQYSVLFGHNVVTPNETSTFRVNLDTNPAELVVLQGNVQAANANVFSVNVRAGETVRFDADDARYFLASSVEPDSWDQWNIDRDQALASMASRQTAINGLGDQSGAGWSDLDQYGDWYSVPQYGNVWAPRGVDLSWDPYGSGYWAYYPSYGYVWVSSNPWGWLPYRCGRWSYFDGFGWGWLPGNCGNEWITDINIWNAPGYYRKPQRPHPVGPRDNLPVHGALIAVNRGIGSGAGFGAPTGGLVHTTRPRTFLAEGHVIQPLPKTIVGQPASGMQLAGPTSTVRLPADYDSRYRPMTSQRNQPGARAGDQQGYVAPRTEYNGAKVATKTSDELIEQEMTPYLTAPGAAQRPGYGGAAYGNPGAQRPGSTASPMAPRQAPPAYAPTPRYEPRESAPAPRASSPPPESRSSPPPSAPAPAPAAGKK
ncbi:MAG TPA: DUF6600 domain-containing protein [Acidisarcina sp.]